jgi:hypothetical protein
MAARALNCQSCNKHSTSLPTGEVALPPVKPSQPARRYAPIAAAAGHAAVSAKTIRRRIADGSLTGFRMGPRLLRVGLNELDTLLSPIPTAGDAA